MLVISADQSVPKIKTLLTAAIILIAWPHLDPRFVVAHRHRFISRAQASEPLRQQDIHSTETVHGPNRPSQATF